MNVRYRVRRAPDLILANPLWCDPGQGQRMHFDLRVGHGFRDMVVS